MGNLGIVVICIAGFASLGAAEKTKPVEAGKKSRPWDFRIVDVQRVELSANEIGSPLGRGDYRRLAKWEVTTVFTNNSKSTVVFAAVPCYGASVRGKLEPDSFGSGSHGPLTVKERDFIQVHPSGTLKSKHWVFATRDRPDGKLTISGFFAKNEDVPKELQCNNFSYEWKLSDTPVGKEFELSISLFDLTPPVILPGYSLSQRESAAKKLLGEDYKKLWKGQILTKPVKIEIAERHDLGGSEGTISADVLNWTERNNVATPTLRHTDDSRILDYLEGVLSLCRKATNFKIDFSAIKPKANLILSRRNGSTVQYSIYGGYLCSPTDESVILCEKASLVPGEFKTEIPVNEDFFKWIREGTVVIP